MNTNLRHVLLPAMMLGAVLLTPGCSTPTTRIGVTSKSDRTLLRVSSPVPTPVRCSWRQDGARCEHRSTTPFRLILPGGSVEALTLTKPAGAADVVVELSAPDAKPTRFVMGRGSGGLRWARDGHLWEAQGF